jgi:hypothetical protein
MKPLKLIGILLIAILTSLAMSTGAWAKKGGKPGGGGDGTETGHVSMDATGAVDAFQYCEERLAAEETSYLCNKSGADHEIILGNFLTNHAYPNGSIAANCFGLSGVFPVTIGVDLNKNKSAETVLRFHAFKNDRTTAILYVLRVNDPRGWNGAFPPAVGKATTMGELDGQTVISWDLGASNRNQERNACVDSGTFAVNGSDFIKVNFTRID